MRNLVGMLCVVAMLSGCTATGGAGYGVSQQTATQRAIAQCVAVVGVGAIAGALIGSASGRRSAGSGAFIGAGVGAGACAVLLQLAAREDQERIRELERQAIAANSARSTTFQTRSGARARVRTVVREAPVPTPAPAREASSQPSSVTFTACRYSETTADVNGQSAQGGRQLWCRTNVGDWQPVAA